MLCTAREIGGSVTISLIFSGLPIVEGPHALPLFLGSRFRLGDVPCQGLKHAGQPAPLFRFHIAVVREERRIRAGEILVRFFRG